MIKKDLLLWGRNLAAYREDMQPKWTIEQKELSVQTRTATNFQQKDRH